MCVSLPHSLLCWIIIVDDNLCENCCHFIPKLRNLRKLTSKRGATNRCQKINFFYNFENTLNVKSIDAFKRAADGRSNRKGPSLFFFFFFNLLIFLETRIYIGQSKLKTFLFPTRALKGACNPALNTRVGFPFVCLFHMVHWTRVHLKIIWSSSIWKNKICKFSDFQA